MSSEIDTVLVPTDGSDGALEAARSGIKLARTFGASVDILAVIEHPELDFSAPDNDDGRSAVQRRAESAVDAVADLATEIAPNLTVTTSLDRDEPHRAIVAYIDEHDVDVVAIGTHGRSGIERVLLGSVCEKVLRTVDIPVLAVPTNAESTRASETGYESILLPTDGSDRSFRAVDWGISLADAYDATAHAVYSVDTSRIPTQSPTTDILSELDEMGEQALATIRERAVEAEVAVQGTVARGAAARVILEYVDQYDTDLVVMATHGRSGIARYVLGSVTEHVIRKAPVPVFCVPPEL